MKYLAVALLAACLTGCSFPFLPRPLGGDGGLYTFMADDLMFHMRIDQNVVRYFSPGVNGSVPCGTKSGNTIQFELSPLASASLSSNKTSFHSATFTGIRDISASEESYLGTYQGFDVSGTFLASGSFVLKYSDW